MSMDGSVVPCRITLRRRGQPASAARSIQERRNLGRRGHAGYRSFLEKEENPSHVVPTRVSALNILVQHVLVDEQLPFHFKAVL